GEYARDFLARCFFIGDTVAVAGSTVEADPRALAVVRVVRFGITVTDPATVTRVALGKLGANGQQARNRVGLRVRVEVHILDCFFRHFAGNRLVGTEQQCRVSRLAGDRVDRLVFEDLGPVEV